jgi:hypothetical protein
LGGSATIVVAPLTPASVAPSLNLPSPSEPPAPSVLTPAPQPQDDTIVRVVAGGDDWRVGSPALLHAWCLEGRVLPEDTGVTADGRQVTLHSRGELLPFFEAARVLAASDTMITERAFATVVLAYLRLSLSSEPIPGADIGLKPFEPGYEWCELRRLAIDALDQLERLALPGAQTGPGFAAAGLGLAPECVVIETIVRSARHRLAHGTSDLCIVLRALGNSNYDNDMMPGRSRSTEVESACECLQRVIP